MRLFDSHRVGCYLDAVGLRLEKTTDAEHKVIDLTLRVQPLTPELATALHPDVRALLFALTDGTPKPLLKAVALNLGAIPNQHIECYLLPDGPASHAFGLLDAEISDLRVRTEKGVDGFALIFYATVGPVGKDELEYVTNWYTQQRFLSFRDAQQQMEFDDDQKAEQGKPRKAKKETASEPQQESLTH